MKKTLTVISIFVIICIAGGWFAYNSWKNSPSYSLSKAGLALQTGDTMLMEKYINIDSILDNAINSAMQKGMDETGSKDNEIANMFIMGFTSALKPRIVDGIKQTIISQIKDMSKDPETAAKIKIKSVKTLRKDGDIASVEIIVTPPDSEDIRMVLGMKKYSDYWKVEQIQNPEENILKLMEEDSAPGVQPSSDYERDIAINTLSLIASISASMERARLLSDNDTYPVNLALLDIEFTDNSGRPASGSSFNTKYFNITVSGTTKSSGKITAKRIGPESYTITRYYYSGEISCTDNNSGICRQVGLKR